LFVVGGGFYLRSLFIEIFRWKFKNFMVHADLYGTYWSLWYVLIFMLLTDLYETILQHLGLKATLFGGTLERHVWRSADLRCRRNSAVLPCSTPRQINPFIFNPFYQMPTSEFCIGSYEAHFFEAHKYGSLIDFTSFRWTVRAICDFGLVKGWGVSFI
jgi:hypothetical protein